MIRSSPGRRRLGALDSHPKIRARPAHLFRDAILQAALDVVLVVKALVGLAPARTMSDHLEHVASLRTSQFPTWSAGLPIHFIVIRHGKTSVRQAGTSAIALYLLRARLIVVRGVGRRDIGAPG